MSLDPSNVGLNPAARYILAGQWSASARAVQDTLATQASCRPIQRRTDAGAKESGSVPKIKSRAARAELEAGKNLHIHDPPIGDSPPSCVFMPNSR